MQCVILVGGLGTRLGDLTDNCPKPMLSVSGRPFLEYLIDNVSRFGVTSILLLAGYRADVIRAHFPHGVYRTPGRVVIVEVIGEPEPLGTGGALRFAADRLAPQFFMLNGDSLFSFNLLNLAAPLPNGGLGRIALREVEDASRYGVVHCDATGRALGMLERPSVPGPGQINGGVYWLERDVVDCIAAGRAVSLEREVFPQLIERGALHARRYDGFFLDIGIPADYEVAQRLMPRRRPAVFFDRDGVLNHDAGYTHRTEDFAWITGAIESVRIVNERDCYAFVVTNQAGVAHGHYNEADIRHLHDWMNRQLAAHGAHIDDFRYCPHHPEAAQAAYRTNCSWRKPGAGMLRDLLAHWPIDLERSILIGDKTTDLEAAAAIGLRSERFDGGDLSQVVDVVL